MDSWDYSRTMCFPSAWSRSCAPQLLVEKSRALQLLNLPSSEESWGVWSKAHGERSQRIYNHLFMPSSPLHAHTPPPQENGENVCEVVICPRGGIFFSAFFQATPCMRKDWLGHPNFKLLFIQNNAQNL